MNTDILFAFSIFQVTFLLLDVYILAMTGRDIARKIRLKPSRVDLIPRRIHREHRQEQRQPRYNLLGRRLLESDCALDEPKHDDNPREARNHEQNRRYEAQHGH